MKEEIRNFLIDVAKEKGWKRPEEEFVELLIDGKEVWSGEEDERRHWIEYTKVVQVKDRFFMFGWAKGAGDQGIFDAGWEFDPESIIEVKPVTKTVTVTDYVAV